MDQEIWQQLLSLESRDQVQKWFKRIHSREINTRRSKEINAAAKQAREYFRNANYSNYTVRPLLTFYGVACLTRALLLLMKKSGGEENLIAGHGLETVQWGSIMSGETSTGLASLCDLTIRTCKGLFSDFIEGTDNRISIHVNSSGVDWSICYDIPQLGAEISLGDLLARLPDLQSDYINVRDDVKYAGINQLSYSKEKGFKAKVKGDSFRRFKDVYEKCGYNIACDDQWCDISSDVKTFSANIPLFIHAYIQKTFGSIPALYIAEPFLGKRHYSQLGVTYMVGFFLGMLVRYYPTHWISLIQGDKGDAIWPTINRAQHLVERSYPELVIELIHDVLKKGHIKDQDDSSSEQSQGESENA